MNPKASDAEVIKGSMTDPGLFGEIFERHYEVIRRYLQRRGGRELGEELAARTFEEAFVARHRYRHTYPSARPWLFGIATNLLRKELRGEAIHLSAVERVSGHRPIQDPGIDRADERLEAERYLPTLARALATLSVRDRDALLLFAWNDFTYEEVAIALSIPVGTVRSRLNRARNHLRELLEPLDAIDRREDL